MTRINRLTAVLASVFGSALVAQSATAGSGCPHAAMIKAKPGNAYVQPALYRPGFDAYPAAGMYRTGMGYGHGNYDNKHSGGYGGDAHGAPQTEADIVDTAVAADNFSILVTAVKAAGLVDTLKGEGPFTVFAPTDEAFAKIPQEKLQALLSDKAALTRVLTYHVVPGRLQAADVVGQNSIKTVEGQSITVETGDAVRVSGATVVKTDISTSNGVIHVIDSVMLPPDMLSKR